MSPVEAFAREERRRRREALRRAHPDTGGDAELFTRVAHSFRSGSADEVRFVRRPRGLSRLSGWGRRRVRHWLRPPARRVI